MSMKQSLFYKEWQESFFIHIYKSILDDNFYLETKEGRLVLPEKIAIKISKSLETK